MNGAPVIWRLSLGLAVATTLAASSRVTADDVVKSDDPLQQRLIEIAHSFDLTHKDSSQEVSIAEQPLLKWANPTREGVQEGLVYVWESDGRPEVIGSAFTFVVVGRRMFKMQMHSLSPSALRVVNGSQTVWTPLAKAIEWKVFSDAPPPTSDARRRLTQMRQLARRFRLLMTSKEDELLELRLLPQPLHRYKSPKHRVTDGAIFSYVTATDPDALLLIEDIEIDGNRQYRYAFARFHFWAIQALDHNGAAVWDVPADMTQMYHQMGDASQFEKPYVSFVVASSPVKASSEPDDQ